MKQLVTTGIVLSRTDFGEADRIITVLTPEHGKLRLMARGVRKHKSKLAGGIELFSVSSITYIAGKGEIGTLISSRLDKHYGNIIKNIDRVQLGYQLIKQLNKATEDHPEAAYFDLLNQAFSALDEFTISTELITVWFEAQLLRQAGHSPNLLTDNTGRKLSPQDTYTFDYESMSFVPQGIGRYRPEHVKILRLLFSQHDSHWLNSVSGLSTLVPDLAPLVHSMLTSYIRV